MVLCSIRCKVSRAQVQERNTVMENQTSKTLGTRCIASFCIRHPGNRCGLQRTKTTQPRGCDQYKCISWNPHGHKVPLCFVSIETLDILLLYHDFSIRTWCQRWLTWMSFAFCLMYNHVYDLTMWRRIAFCMSMNALVCACLICHEFWKTCVTLKAMVPFQHRSLHPSL